MAHRRVTYFLAVVIAICTAASMQAQVEQPVISVDTLDASGSQIIDSPQRRINETSASRNIEMTTASQNDRSKTALNPTAERFEETDTVKADTLITPDVTKSLVVEQQEQGQTEVVETKKWVPDPKKALWYAIVIPGGGQIYNRKFWKLPLIYGGFMGCFYAISWNNTMYRDYAQAYIDIMDDDPNTRSYENFIPLSYDVNANLERLQTLFKKKKDYYRRYRDLSIFCAIGVYALSIIDAYVDAELSSFDISKDLSMKVKPSIINDRATASYNGNSYGIKCAITF